MLIDLHAHSSGISTCCRIHVEKVVEAAKEAELDGIVLTNHYYSAYIKDGDCSAFAERYYAEYLKARECGEKIGVKVFFGIELTMDRHNRDHLLIYGVGKDFLMKYPKMFDLTLEELHVIVKEYNGIMVQAHPFRGNTTLMDARFLDGVEVNCHPLYYSSEFDRVKAIAINNGLFLTCGGDYHADTYRPKCGVCFPDTVSDESALCEYLRNAESVLLYIHEPNTKFPYYYEHIR